MVKFEEEQKRNFAAYERLKDEIHTKYAGLYVAIADGKLLKVATTIEEARKAVQKYKHRLVFQVDHEPLRDPVYLR